MTKNLKYVHVLTNTLYYNDDNIRTVDTLFADKDSKSRIHIPTFYYN